jgi:hypothetical protein
MASRRSKLERRVGLLLDRGHRSSGPGRGALLAPAAFATLASVLPLPAFAMHASDAAEGRAYAAGPEATHEATDALVVDRPGGISGEAGTPGAERRASARPGTTLVEDWASIRADLGALEAEFTSLRSDLALAGAPAELEARLGEIRERLDALRALETELDRIVAEDPSAERPEQ